MAVGVHGRGGARPRLLAPLAVSEFRALFVAELLSVAGDQLARVGLAVLVFSRTQSAALTGLTYALTFVPAFLGGAVFGSLGDRYPRRTVMLVADVGRAALLACAAFPRVPIWVLCVVVAAATFLNGPFKAAQQALLPTVLPEPFYKSGMALRNVGTQTAQLVGFGAGGLVVSVIGASWSLALDAATFAVSALLIGTRVVSRPPVASARLGYLTAMRRGATSIWRDPAARALTGLVWLAGFYIVPEALAGPYAAELGTGSTAVGLLMASDPAGSVIAGIVVGAWVSESAQHRWLGLLGITAGLPLAACVLHPPLVVAMMLFGASGAAATAYTIGGVAEFTRRLPENQRAQASGLLSAGLLTGQGVGALLAGFLTDRFGPATTVGLAGVVGSACAIPIARAWARHRHDTHIDDDVGSGTAVGHE